MKRERCEGLRTQIWNTIDYLHLGLREGIGSTRFWSCLGAHSDSAKTHTIRYRHSGIHDDACSYRNEKHDARPQIEHVVNLCLLGSRSGWKHRNSSLYGACEGAPRSGVKICVLELPGPYWICKWFIDFSHVCTGLFSYLPRRSYTPRWTLLRYTYRDIRARP